MILRRIQDVEKIDVGKKFGKPEGVSIIQWIFYNEVGDERYHPQTRGAQIYRPTGT